MRKLQSRDCLLLVVCLGLSYSGNILAALDASTIHAAIVDYGIYELQGKRVIQKEPGTTAGYTSRPKKKNSIVHSRTTKEVRLVKGTLFGYRVKLHGPVDGAKVPIILRFKHPPIVGHDGKVSTGFSLNRLATISDDRFSGGIFYRLSEDYELVAGEWNFAVLYGDRVLAEMTFTLVE